MRWFVVSVCAAAAILTTACGGDETATPPAPAAGDDVIDVTSAVFEDGQAIPSQYTCDGEEVSPPIQWSGVPAGAEALALVVDDPDAPGGGFVHWVVVDIPPNQQGSAEGSAPVGGRELKNSAGHTAYAGPCPPSGTHHYRFTVYALSKLTGLDADASLDTVFDTIDSAAVAHGDLVGTYQRR